MHALIYTELSAIRRRRALPGQRVRRPVELLFVVGSLLLLTGCSGETDLAHSEGDWSSSGVPKISAKPNPVPAGSKKFGTTTISWNTGDGSIGEVYVSVKGAPEKLFAGKRSQGSLEAPWIGKGAHEFRLYAGTQHKKVLASVTVTRLSK